MKRILALFLAVLMCVSLLPLGALADGEAPEIILDEEVLAEEISAEEEENVEVEESAIVEEAVEAEETFEADEAVEVEEPVEDGEPAEVEESAEVEEPVEAEEAQTEGVPPERDGDEPALVVEAEKQVTAEAAEVSGEDETTAVTYTEQIGFDGLAADNDALFAGYVDQVLYGRSGAELPLQSDGLSLGDRLGTNNRALYQYLKERIAKVAAGEAASTAFSIPLADFGFDKQWTAAELGVGSAMSEEGLAALDDALAIDQGVILDALLRDCPYEMYWCDKTAGVRYDTSYTGTSGTIRLASMTFSFAVAGDFAGSGAYTVDTAKTAAATTAVSTAASIVAKYAGKSDYQKLVGYRDEICALADYNYTAADPENGVAFGNPWQLLWVFDGDPSTKVVCEGYAKAFQYLCDRTSFQSDKIACVCVTGVMSGGTGAGEHMWNLVFMDDGKSYLVDVTNCDGDSRVLDGLFLAGLAYGDSMGTFGCKREGSMLYYVYDVETKALFTAAELTLAGADYEEGKSAPAATTAPASTATPAATATPQPAATSTPAETTPPEPTATPAATAMPVPTAAAKSIAKAKVTLSATSYTYNGKAKKPTPTVKLGSKTLKKGTDYTVTYKNNKAVGKATVVITGKGNYKGTVKATFKINPKATKLSSAKNTAAKKITAKWKKVAGVTGYQVQYSTSKTFKSYKTVTVKGVKNVSKVISKLTKGKTYYVRVRTYQTVSKTKYYSAWSAVKKVKITK